MISWGFAALTVFGAAIAIGMRWSLRRLLASPPAVSVGALPAVSILKPLKGVDEKLAENLATFFALDHPAYEVVFGVNDPEDPALAVARRVAGAHPEVPVRFVADPGRTTLNPKVGNLANMLPAAAHEVILISDSNVAVAPGYLRELCARLLRPGVGLVSSPVRGVAGTGLGAALERYQLNTFVMAGVAGLHGIFGVPAVMGKSMLLRRSDLLRFGGFPFLGRYLAEDQVCGEEVLGLGLSLELSPRTVDNVLGRLTLLDFARRHLRWARIRRRMSPVGYAGELLVNPVFAATVGLVVARDLVSVVAFGGAVLLMSALGARTERKLGVPRPLAGYPLLEIGRALLTGVLWIVPYFSSRVSWRGHAFRVGKRTLLTPR